MGVKTTADRKRDEAKEHLQKISFYCWNREANELSKSKRYGLTCTNQCQNCKDEEE